MSIKYNYSSKQRPRDVQGIWKQYPRDVQGICKAVSLGCTRYMKINVLGTYLMYLRSNIIEMYKVSGKQQPQDIQGIRRAVSPERKCYLMYLRINVLGMCKVFGKQCPLQVNVI